MNSKIILSALVLLCCSTSVLCQTLKTFKGEYDDGTANKGYATYTYYEDKKTLEYIKQGAFKFTYSDKDEISSQKVSISGNYKNNQKDGIWSFIITYTNWPNNANAFITGAKTLTASYVNGKPKGSWIYRYDFRTREKRFSSAGFIWTPFVTGPSELVTATFRDGIITGPVTFVNNPPYGQYNNITGQYDNLGRMVGKWIYKSPDKEKVCEFKNGIVVSFIVRQTSSGRITSKDIDDQEMTRIKNDFIIGKITTADLTKLNIKIDTVDAVKNDDYDFVLSFKSKDFRFEYIPGDDSYYYRPSIYNEVTHENIQDAGWVDTRNEGKFYIFTQLSSN